MKIDDVETDEFIAAEESGKLKIRDHRKLLLYFDTEDTGIRCGDTRVNLTGETYGGLGIEGSGGIRTEGCRGGDDHGGDRGSGGAGGGGIGSEEPFDNIDLYETREGYPRADRPVSYRFTKAGLWITEIVITATENENEVSIRIEALKGKSRNAAELMPGAKYINILAGTKKIKEAQIRFRVENSWLSSAGFSGDGVSMYRWVGSKWDRLETAVVAKDLSYTYYEANAPGFSKFAIAGSGAGETEFPETAGEESSQALAEPPEAAETPSGKAPPVDLAIILGMAVLIAAVVAVFIRRKRK
ncbi:MAG: PGF-pre-PGF domain-containing protein [Candidatus Methanoperedens sp.]|nr:PGF-pre-PGF domain-containing protein [Candidatus Methanoperedens sp.]